MYSMISVRWRWDFAFESIILPGERIILPWLELRHDWWERFHMICRSAYVSRLEHAFPVTFVPSSVCSFLPFQPVCMPLGKQPSRRKHVNDFLIIPWFHTIYLMHVCMILIPNNSLDGLKSHVEAFQVNFICSMRPSTCREDCNICQYLQFLFWSSNNRRTFHLGIAISHVYYVLLHSRWSMVKQQRLIHRDQAAADLTHAACFRLLQSLEARAGRLALNWHAIYTVMPHQGDIIGSTKSPTNRKKPP